MKQAKYKNGRRRKIQLDYKNKLKDEHRIMMSLRCLKYCGTFGERALQPTALLSELVVHVRTCPISDRGSREVPDH